MCSIHADTHITILAQHIMLKLGLVFGGPDGTVVGGLVFGSLVFDSLVSGDLKWGGAFVGGELGTCP